jgi:hypothetical protein
MHAFAKPSIQYDSSACVRMGLCSPVRVRLRACIRARTAVVTCDMCIRAATLRRCSHTRMCMHMAMPLHPQACCVTISACAFRRGSRARSRGRSSTAARLRTCACSRGCSHGCSRGFRCGCECGCGWGWVCERLCVCGYPGAHARV